MCAGLAMIGSIVPPVAPDAEAARELLERELDNVCADLGDAELQTLVLLACRLRGVQWSHGCRRSQHVTSRERIVDLVVELALEVFQREPASP